MELAHILLTLTLAATPAPASNAAAPTAACPSGSLREASRAFQESYKAKKYGQAVTTLEPAFSRCENTLAPDERARILSDLSIAAFRNGDKKLCVQYIDRVPGNISSFSDVAYAIEHNRRLCTGGGGRRFR
jgi:hypothetical protein